MELNKTALFVALFAMFIAGWFFNSAYTVFANENLQNLQFPMPIGVLSPNNSSASQKIESVKAGPQDRIAENQIHVYEKGIYLSVENTTWARFTDTHSMEPVLNKDSHGIEVAPKSESDISIGDVVSYKSEFADGLIVHRVVAQGYDEKGWYVIMKGDNLNSQDPGKVRFSQIHGVLVAVVY